jgi:hypothetical protein
MIEVTRLYTQKKSKTVKKQVVALAPAAIESVRSSTVLKGQKATIRTLSGFEIPVMEVKQDILSAMGARVKKVVATSRR